MTAPEITVRPHRDTDVPVLVDVIRAAFAEYRGRLDPPSSAERKSPEVVRAELADGGALVAEHGATVVGCVFWHPRDDGIYLDRLAVLPPWRGHGVGRRLVDAVEALARDTGAHHVSLSVRLALERQRAWYASLGYGFLSEGTHPGYDRPTNVTLRKPLAPST